MSAGGVSIKMSEEPIHEVVNTDTQLSSNQDIMSTSNIQLSRRAKKDLLEWRRSQVISSYSTGKTIPEISKLLKVSHRTIQRDLRFLRQQSRDTLSKQIEEVLPFEHQKRIVHVEKIIRELWILYAKAQESREQRAILDSLVQATLVRASLDADAGSIDRSLKAITAIRKKLRKSGVQDEPSDSISVVVGQ